MLDPHPKSAEPVTRLIQIQASDDPQATRPKASRAPFGTTPDGERVELFTLSNAAGMLVRITNFGGIIASLVVPDRSGAAADVVLGYETLHGYLGDTDYLGAIVGRCAGRIAGARFTLDGTPYPLSANNGPNHLHGGRRGFNKVVWRAVPVAAARGSGLALEYRSPDGEEGYPGTLEVRVTYTLTDSNELVVDIRATSDKPTPVNLTQHSCFNLAGAGAGDILGHRLTVNSEMMLPVDESQVPTGEIVPLAGGPFDFRAPAEIGARIGSDDEQLRRGGGYDHDFVLKRSGPGLVHAARAVDPGSGRILDVHTTEPGLHLYTGNYLGSGAPGKAGRRYPRRGGFCLEAQHFPDSPNQPGFPDTILRPGAEYRSQTVFAFSVTD